MSEDLYASHFMDQDWYDKEKYSGDSGYGDSFRALKSQIDYNYKRYKEQLSSLDDRKAALIKDKNDSFNMFLMILFAPVVIFLLMELFTYLGSKHGFFGLFAITFLVMIPIVVIICEFFLLPAAARNLVNNIYRVKVMNLPGSGYKSGKTSLSNGNMNNTGRGGSWNNGSQIITFVDEKKYLLARISEIETFNRRIENFGLDQKGGKFKLGASSGELSDADQKILEEMRELSVFREYKATVSEIKREAGYSWILVGFGILVGVIIAFLAF